MLVIEPYSGLTSRILTINEAYLLAKKNQTRLMILWNITNDCCCNYFDIFERDQFRDIRCTVIQKNYCGQTKPFVAFAKESFQEHKILPVISNFIQRAITASTDKIIEVYFKHYQTYYSFVSDKPQETTLVAPQIRAKLAQHYNLYIRAYCGIMKDEVLIEKDLSALCFSDSAKKEADIILGGETVIGVHIRRTDHDEAITHSRTADFVTRMQTCIQNNEKVRFYLATDDIREESRLREIFGNRIIAQTKKDFSRSSKAGMHAALIDVLCLSKTQYILGSYTSVYSKFAATYGHIELVTI